MNNAVCPDCSQVQAVVAGMSMIAMGAALIISESRGKKASEGEVPTEGDIVVIPKNSRKITFGAEPIKDNWAVGTRIEW